MANATTKVAPAPLKKEMGALEQEYLDREYDPAKKYMYQLAEENGERDFPVIDMVSKRPLPNQKFKPTQNIVLTSMIVWNGGRVAVRYYEGCESIFVSEQPKDKDTIDELIKRTPIKVFEHGQFGVYGEEKRLLQFLDICSWNVESPFRTRSASGIFRGVDNAKIAKKEEDKLDLIDKAFSTAKDATSMKMLIHANYLGIPVVDMRSQNPLTDGEIRTAYRKYALENAKSFLDSYGDSSLETKYFISKAWTDGIINNKMNPNTAAWGKSGREIVDISGLSSQEGIVQKLFEYGQTTAGEEFIIQLKALYN